MEPLALRPGRARRRPPGHPGGRGFAALLADLDTDAVPVAADDVPGTATGDGLTWAAHDRDDPTWWPQGVAALDGGRVLLVGWYERPSGPWWRWRPPRSRVSAVDRSDPQRPRYRHVELVVPHRRPLGWARALGRVPVHAGGLAVVVAPGGERLLLVADTLFGLRVFALDDAVRRPGAEDGDDGGAWVLPQRRAVRVPLLAGGLSGLSGPSGPGRDRFRFSWCGVDGTGAEPSLLAGEYRRAGEVRSDGPPRLVRYRLDPVTGLPVGAPTAVHAGQPPRVQGVAALAGGRWVLSASAGHDRCGDLHVGRPGAWTVHRGALPPGCEDLDPADPADPGSPLWGASEHPGRRWVYPVRVPG